MWAQVFRLVTNHSFDKQTDGRTDSFLVTIPRRMQCMHRGKNPTQSVLLPIKRNKKRIKCKYIGTHNNEHFVNFNRQTFVLMDE